MALANDNFELRSDLAQYKGSDYSNAVRVERGITLDRAFEIAMADPEIDYFVYMKDYPMVLEIPQGVAFDPAKDPLHLVTITRFIDDSGRSSPGYCRIFYQGDTVFFKREGMWLAAAPGLADTYVKIIK